MSHYIDDAAEGSGSEADHEDDYDSNAEEDGDETHGGFINDASSESGAEDEPGVRPRLSDEEMSDGEDVRQYVAQLRREKRAHSNLSGGQGGDGGAAGNRGKRKIVDDSDDDSGGADEGNRDKRKVRDDSDDDAGGAGEGNHGKRKIMNDSDDDSGGAGECNRGKRKIMDDSDDDSGQGKGGTSRRGMESDSDDSAGHAERDADKGEEGTGKRKMAEDKNNKEHTDDDMQTDSGDEADAQTRRALAAHRVHDSTQPTLLVGAYDSDNDAKNMDTEMVDANSGDLIGGYSFQTPTHTCETVPQSAAQALGEMGISETSTMGGITFLPDRQAIQLYDARKRSCNRYAWVAPIDEKGSTSTVIKKLLYNLHHVRKFYDSVDKPNAKNAPFEPLNAVPNDANVNYRGGMAYHYITLGDDVVTVPPFNISMFIDVAHTGGNSAMSQAYQFVVLETPLTLDLVENITLSCKHVRDPDGALICETMKTFWCDIASSMYRMGGETSGLDACNIASVRYEDLFDDISPYCIWKLFRVSRCIAAARRHMHLMATNVRHANASEAWKDASSRVEVRFESIDKGCCRRDSAYAYDNLFVQISDRSASAWYVSYESYKVVVEKHKKKKKAAGAKGGDDDAPEPDVEEPCEPFDPPVVYDCPFTQIDFNDSDTREFLRNTLSKEHIDMHALEDFLHQAGAETVHMRGFPECFMCASVELNLFRPDTGRYTKYDDWVATNPCTLPSKMTLPLLLLKDSGIGSDSDDITNPSAIYASLESNLPKNCLHIEEYRQFLRSGGNASNIRRPLKGRCDHIYFMQSKAIANILCPRRRVSCMYDAYVSGTVIPLVEANVRSDNGEMGGSEPRLAVLSEVAGSPAPETDPGRRCWIMHKFTEGLHTLLQNFPEATDIINRHRGGLHSAESLLYLIHHIKNINGNLKPDNQRMNFMLADSDVGFYLNGLGSQFEMAKNFIGLTLWCQNCNGNADTREKTRGTGVDEGLNQFIHGQTPMHTDPPPMVDISLYPDTAETKGASSTALFNKYSTTITKTGERLDSITVNQPNLWLTEMKQDQDGKNPNWAILNDNILRNTSAATLGKRDLSVQDNNGRWNSCEQILIMQPRILMVASNANDRSHYAHTVETVCTIVAAGGVDQDDTRPTKRRRGMGARQDMGMQARFYGRREIPWVSKVSHMLGRDITTLSTFAAFVHSCSFFGHQGAVKTKAGVETCWQDIIVSLVHQHQPWMNQRAACQQNWSRIVEMARTRAVPYGMQLHATNVLLHPDARKKTWHNLVHETLVNFLADPVPAQALPVFAASLMATSFDWLFFICLGMFCNMFEVPELDAQTMEAMFSSSDTVVPDSQARSVRKWLESSGFGGQGGPRQKRSAIVAPHDAGSMARSAVYVTTYYEDGGDFTDTSLTCNVEPPRQGGYGEDAKAVSTNERVCIAIAKVLVKLFAGRLRSACNIADHDQGNYKAFRPLAACLLKYATEALPYHKFGPVPSGEGWRSVNGICRSLGLSAGFSGQGFTDGAGGSDLDAYATTPFLVRQAAGNIYQFAVDVRWLIFVKAVYGDRPTVSQSSVQAVPHHLTEQLIIHRIPRSIFPASHIFTSMTCAETGGFAYTKLPSDARPATMVRPTPDSIVLDAKSKVSCGLMDNLVMPEDCALSAPARRLASSVADATCPVDVTDVVLPQLKPPQIAPGQHVYVEVRLLSATGDPDQDRLHAGVVFSEDTVQGVLYVDEEADPRAGQVARLDRDGQLAHRRFRHSDLAHVQRSLTTLHEGSLYRALAPSAQRLLHFPNYYCRPGILLELEVQDGCTTYAVVKQWTREDIPCAVRYFNPNTMGYLAVCNAVERESLPWPATAPLDLADRPGLFQWQELSFNVPSPLMPAVMVPIGRQLFLDVGSSDAARLTAGGSLELGYVESPAVELTGAKRAMPPVEFASKVAPQPSDGSKVALLPVVPVTLCYEVPASVLCHEVDAADDREDLVYVGFRVLQKQPSRRVSENIQYAAVRARSLVTQSRVDLLNLRPVVFGVFD